MIGGRIVPRFQELTPDKLGKVKISVILRTSVLVVDVSFFFFSLTPAFEIRLDWCERNPSEQPRIECCTLSNVPILKR